MSSQIGIIGLSEHSYAFSRRLLDKGYRVVAYDDDRQKHEQYVHPEITLVSYLEDLGNILGTKRIIFIFMTDGKSFDHLLEEFISYLSVSDIIIDLSTSSLEETLSRKEFAQGFQVDMLDAVLDYRRNEFNIWISGNRFAYAHCEPMLLNVVGNEGLHFVGTSGRARVEFVRQQGNLD
jgi:6-phosphogluconate dehydrogenase (decarboxylating)